MEKASLVEFADRINKIMPVIIREFVRHQANELYEGKITIPQFLVLDLLTRSGESKMTALAQVMKVSTAAMTGVVDKLVKYAYAARESEPKDRRIIKIRVTRKGLELVKKINRQRRQMVIDIFGKVSEIDRREYLKILTRIHDILTKGQEE